MCQMIQQLGISYVETKRVKRHHKNYAMQKYQTPEENIM